MTRRQLFALAAATPAMATTLREESIARLIGHELPGMEYVLLRASDASVVASHWRAPEIAAPLGSLVKPFVALAYAESHGLRYPEFDCTGCWTPRGHGRIGIGSAIAQSCNSYFVQLACQVAVEDVERIADRYGLPMPADPTPESLIGHYGTWRATPVAAALAYNEIVHRRSEPEDAMVFNAMRRCARMGTAMGLGASIAAKTGTAPCVHSVEAPGDGLLAAMFPEDAPEWVLLARIHGAPGAECARRSGAFVRAVMRR